MDVEQELIVKTSVSDSASQKSATASCPSGKRPVGTGAKVTPASAWGKVALLRITPEAATNSVTADGVEVSGTSSLWSVTAYAICAKSFDSYQVVQGQSPFDVTSTKAATAQCGSKLLGAGGHPAIAGAAGKVALTGIFPWTDHKSALASGAKTQTSTTSWVVNSYAICGDFGPSLGYWYEDGSSNSSSPKSITRSCPAGTVLIGAGGKVNTTASGKVALASIEPSSDLKSVTVTGAEIAGGTSSNWSVTAWAICHNP